MGNAYRRISQKHNLTGGETCEKRVELKRRRFERPDKASKMRGLPLTFTTMEMDATIRKHVTAAHVSAMLITYSASDSKINSAV